MPFSRKEFFKVVARAAAGTAVASSVGSPRSVSTQSAAGATKPRKVEGAAIKGSTVAVKRFITNTTLGTIPPDAIQQAKRCVIDGIGVILAGSTVRGSAIVREYVKSVAAKAEATALGPE